MLLEYDVLIKESLNYHAISNLDTVIIRQSIFSFHKDSVQALWSEVVRKPWLWVNCPSYSSEKLTSCLAWGIMLPGFPKLLLSHITSSGSPMLIHYLKMSLQKLFLARLWDSFYDWYWWRYLKPNSSPILWWGWCEWLLNFHYIGAT